VVLKKKKLPNPHFFPYLLPDPVVFFPPWTTGHPTLPIFLTHCCFLVLVAAACCARGRLGRLRGIGRPCHWPPYCGARRQHGMHADLHDGGGGFMP